jgi:hypothetical protein
MSFLIDDVARTLATPMPRRKALRFLSGALATGILGTLGIKEAGAQNKTCSPSCPQGTVCCNGVCCNQNAVCCSNVCCKPNQVCCGKTVCCNQNQCNNGRCKASNV